MVSTLWGGRSRTQALEDIRAEARSLDPVRVLLTLVAVPFVVAGWLVGKSALVVWTALSWAWTAAVVGWRAARNRDEFS